MDISKLDTLTKIGLYKTPGLKDFIEQRPQSEDFGESLDIFVREHELMQDTKSETYKGIRGLHLRYQGLLLVPENPMVAVDNECPKNTCDIKDFCAEFSQLTDCQNNNLSDILLKNAGQCNMYILYEIIDYLLRNKNAEIAFPFIATAVHQICDYSENMWNQKEECFGAAQLACKILEIIKNYKFNGGTDNNSIKKIALSAYIITSRVILWPGDSEFSKRDRYNLPISFEHKIGTLLKRIEILEDYGWCFENIVPQESTVDTLIVSDYYAAHEYSFAVETLGRASQFKRDAYDKYDKSHKRPFSTCITDGKKDSFELAYRLFLRYNNGMYRLTPSENDFLIAVIKDNLYKYNTKVTLKKDKELIMEFLRKNNISCFYHFTEKANLASIRKNGGLLSQRECLSRSILPKTSGEMRHLRSKDAEFYLEDYVRLSFCKKHPLIEGRNSQLVLFKVSTKIALLESTLFSDRDAALLTHHHGGTYEDLTMIHLDAIRKEDLSKDDPDFDFLQAEVMVKSFIPKEYIENFDAPEIL